ncbi:hypothetical protein G7054_g9842 [Neopestalotiopsis clavispora]|nr:hypothetical protein G7054_g9842 [Neopestalotiopsis clavispora]
MIVEYNICDPRECIRSRNHWSYKVTEEAFVYAGVCKLWQDVVEQRTFRWLDLSLDRHVETFASLAEVTVIREIYVKSSRIFAPTVVIALLSRLRSVQNANGYVWENLTDLSDRRHHIREGKEVSTVTISRNVHLANPGSIDYARALKDFTIVPDGLYLSHGDSVNSNCREDHSTEPPVSAPRGTEYPLTISLRGLSQRSRDIHLYGVTIGDEFWSSQSGTATDDENVGPSWLLLTDLLLDIRLATPDGRWRFDYADPESQSESEGGSDSGGSVYEPESDYEAINSCAGNAKIEFHEAELLW